MTKKMYGQNFLICEDVVEELVDSAKLEINDVVLEIGPGEGAVTAKLLEKVVMLYTVEVDRDLIPGLERRFAKKLEIINKDALLYLKSQEFLETGINKIVSSLPYQITSPLLHLLVGLKNKIQFVSLLIQKEVAEKILERAPDSNYLSIFLGTFFEIKIVSFVEKECFNPVPEVDGAIITFKTKSEPLIKVEDIERYSKFLHHGFREQRKMLNKRFDKKLLESCGIDATRRAETLTIKEWVKLFESYYAD